MTNKLSPKKSIQPKEIQLIEEKSKTNFFSFLPFQTKRPIKIAAATQSSNLKKFAFSFKNLATHKRFVRVPLVFERREGMGENGDFW